jgi:hypothetical protein
LSDVEAERNDDLAASVEGSTGLDWNCSPKIEGLAAPIEMALLCNPLRAVSADFCDCDVTRCRRKSLKINNYLQSLMLSGD